MEKERDQVSEIVNVETGNADEELGSCRTTANVTACQRRTKRIEQMLGKGNGMLSLRRQEHTAAIDRDVLSRNYQSRINELMNNRVTSWVASSEARSNDSAAAIRVIIVLQP